MAGTAVLTLTDGLPGCARVLLVGALAGLAELALPVAGVVGDEASTLDESGFSARANFGSEVAPASRESAMMTCCDVTQI